MLAYTLQGWNTVGNEKYKDLLLDTGTEEIGHMEMLATMINDLLRDAPTDTIEEVARNSDPVTAAILGGMDPQHAFVNGIGAGLSDSNGNPWSANFIISSGNLLVDMRFNVVRESQDRLQVSRNFLQTEDKGVRDMLSYLMARETQHQLQFLKACEELEEKYGPVVPHGTQDLQKQGKEFTHTLYNFSEGETARDGNKFHYSSDPLMAGGEPDLTALSMDSQTDQLKVQTIKSKQLSARNTGFRSFKNFRLRILISFKNSFYSMNYKQKAADLNNVKSAA